MHHRLQSRLAGLFVLLAVCAGPATAQACSCWDGPADLPTNLREAKAGAIAIYRARVVSIDSGFLRLFRHPASVEVLEVFKGQVKRGERLQLPYGGGGDCTIRFEEGIEYLMYAHGSEPEDVHHCSRTRPVRAGDSELDWLRTGRLPPVPVAIQRESVSCEPCDIHAVGGRLLSPPVAPPGQWDWLYFDPEPEVAHFRTKLRLRSFEREGWGTLQLVLAAGLAEAQVGEDDLGLQFTGTDARRVSTAGPELGVGLRFLRPLASGFELVGDFNLGMAWLPHAPELVKPGDSWLPFLRRGLLAPQPHASATRSTTAVMLSFPPASYASATSASHTSRAVDSVSRRCSPSSPSGS